MSVLASDVKWLHRNCLLNIQKRRRKKSSASVSKQSEDSFAPVDDPGVAEDAASTSSGQRRCPSLDIPFNLVKRLEEDNAMIKKRNKVIVGLSFKQLNLE